MLHLLVIILYHTFTQLKLLSYTICYQFILFECPLCVNRILMRPTCWARQSTGEAPEPPHRHASSPQSAGACMRQSLISPQ